MSLSFLTGSVPCRLLSCAALFVAAPALAQTASAPAAPPPTSAPAVVKPVELSSEVKAVVDAAVEAMGGAAAVEAVKSCHTKGQIETDRGNVGLESMWASDGSFRTKQIVESVGEMETGWNGTVGWQSNGTGSFMTLGKAAAEQMRDQASLHISLLRLHDTIREKFARVEDGGMTAFGDKTCRRLIVVPTDAVEGDTPGHLYFDPQTHLIVGMETIQPGPTGPETVTIRMSDWQPSGDVRFFRAMEMSAAGMPMQMTFSEIHVNTLGPDDFKAPEGVITPKPAASQPASGDASAPNFTPQQQQMIDQMMARFEKQTNPAELTQMATMLEGTKGLINDPEQLKAIEFVIEKIKARVAELGG